MLILFPLQILVGNYLKFSSHSASFLHITIFCWGLAPTNKQIQKNYKKRSKKRNFVCRDKLWHLQFYLSGFYLEIAMISLSQYTYVWMLNKYLIAGWSHRRFKYFQGKVAYKCWISNLHILAGSVVGRRFVRCKRLGVSARQSQSCLRIVCLEPG